MSGYVQKDRDFFISIARRYFFDEKSQQQIAQEFGISRPTVSNILKKCKELGIVQIKIEDNYPYATSAGDALVKAFPLQQALITPTNGADTLKKDVGLVGAQYSAQLLQTYKKIGIAWGTSLYHMVHQLPTAQVPDAQIVQLMGGFGTSSVQYDGSDLAREFSKRVFGKYYPLQCPVLVKDEVVKKLFLKEPAIADTLKMTKNLEVAFVGISSNSPDQSAMVRAGFLSEEEALEIQAAGAVGHVCGYSFDSLGNMLDISYNRRIIGIEFADFLSIPVRVGIAYGQQKAQAIKASLQGGHLTTLITDEKTAYHILDS
ncbi:MAG: sugar-binding transcriptional regulator [Sphaerochaetaceae bacterium]